MKELFRSSVAIGSTIHLDDSWGAKIYENFSKSENCPLKFKVKRKSRYGYFAEAVISDSKKKKNIFLSNEVINYLLGTTVEDSNQNVGFCDFLPNENDKVLVLTAENGEIIPARFALTVKFCPLDSVYYIHFTLENLLDDDTMSVGSQYFNSWKSLSIDEAFLSDVEKMYKDTFVHKEYVLDVCNKFADYLKEKGFYPEARELRNRALVHDNSKITNYDEFFALTSIVSDKSCLENAGVPLSEMKQNSIKLHWKNNSHHPEHFENYEEMSTVDRMEMACDWMARSLQYKSNLLEFVKVRQQDRFHFTDAMFEEVYRYCTILTSLYELGDVL